MGTDLLAGDVAVIGMACRVPGADDLAAYWELLAHGRSPVAPATGMRAGRRAGGYLTDVEYFDAALFGVNPLEAEAMDPQQRMLLELTWHALEDARRPPDATGLGTVGVFVGCCTDDYLRLTEADRRTGDPYRMTGTARAFTANRISYVYGFDGPSMVVDTGQSSSSVALHQALASLRAGECKAAVVAGVQLNLSPEGDQLLEDLGALSPTGQCRTLDAGADGIVRGEGAGVLVLRPLSAALRDGDRIYCRIIASAVNNDGGGPGLTTPSIEAQRGLLSTVYRRAGLDPTRVQYVELHGTGTPAGDPVEATALGEVLGRGRDGASPLVLGSVKTNIGHLEAAAGMASLIKTALCLHHRELVATLNHQKPNPLIDFNALRLQVCTELRPWPESNRELLAGVSSFGLGGTNCHVVLGGPPAQAKDGVPDIVQSGPLAVGLSAHGLPALREQAAQLARLLAAGDEREAWIVAASTTTTRARLALRVALVAQTRDELIQRLQDFSRTGRHPWASHGLPGADCAQPASTAGGLSPAEEQVLAFVQDPAADRQAGRPMAARTDLPLYPFQRKRFWPSHADLVSAAAGVGPAQQPSSTRPKVDLTDLEHLADLANLSHSAAPTASGSGPALAATADDVYGVVIEGVNLILGQQPDDEFDLDTTFADLGLDSRMVVALRTIVATATHQVLPSTLLFDHPTPADLIRALEASDDQGVA